MQLAQAFQKAGLVTSHQVEEVKKEKSEKERVDSELKSLFAQAYPLHNFLRRAENPFHEFLGDSDLIRRSSILSFLRRFESSQEILREFKFHLGRIHDKQKYKLGSSSFLGMDFSDDQTNAWIVRAGGYALLSVLKCERHFPLRLKREVLEWVSKRSRFITEGDCSGNT